MNILLVEDDRPLGLAIKRVLEGAGWAVDWRTRGDEGFEAARAGTWDLLVLDLLLPGKSGLEICDELRKRKRNVPILMLTALGEIEDKVRGLDSGADDYLAKPFEVPELLARIRALARRDKANKARTIAIDDLSIDRSAREVFRAGEALPLTRREYDLLEALAVNEGRVLSRQTIQERVWHDETSVSNVVDVTIRNLRRKVDLPGLRKLIHTVVGFGYVLRIESS